MITDRRFGPRLTYISWLRVDSSVISLRALGRLRQARTAEPAECNQADKTAMAAGCMWLARIQPWERPRRNQLTVCFLSWLRTQSEAAFTM